MRGVCPSRSDGLGGKIPEGKRPSIEKTDHVQYGRIEKKASEIGHAETLSLQYVLGNELLKLVSEESEATAAIRPCPKLF